jgi:hypothetical protein
MDSLVSTLARYSLENSWACNAAGALYLYTLF